MIYAIIFNSSYMLWNTCSKYLIFVLTAFGFTFQYIEDIRNYKGHDAFMKMFFINNSTIVCVMGMRGILYTYFFYFNLFYSETLFIVINLFCSHLFLDQLY